MPQVCDDELGEVLIEVAKEEQTVDQDLPLFQRAVEMEQSAKIVAYLVLVRDGHGQLHQLVFAERSKGSR